MLALAAQQALDQLRVRAMPGDGVGHDLTDVMADVAGTTGSPAGSSPRFVLTWQITGPVDAVPATLPADVARWAECGPTA